jgi:tetratricopeptide (TPR) repeat protein
MSAPPASAPSFEGRPAAEILHYGVEQHQAGRLDLAEAAYRQVLTLAPQEPEALHLLGLVALQTGRPEPAAGLIGAAIRLEGGRAAYHSNLALALRALGRLDEAEASCRRALTLDPDSVATLSTLGGILRAAGRLAEAEDCYRNAVRLKPAFAEGHNNLGNVLRALGRPAEAAASLRAALDLAPGQPAIAVNLAGALSELGRHAEAEQVYRDVLARQPDRAEAQFGLGLVLRKLARPAEAAACFRAALALQPEHPETLVNLASTLLDLERQDEAEPLFRAAIRLKPDLVPAQYGLGRALFERGFLAEAEACCRAVLRLDPDHVWSHFNLAHLLLVTGRFGEGWAHYDWRTQLPGALRRDFAAPLWDGGPIEGKTLLIHAEQGFGDTLQFCRYLPLLAQRARIVAEVPAPLFRLLSCLPGLAGLVVQGAALPEFDLQCPLLSLPHRFGTTLETIPAAMPYLKADPALTAAWRARLAPLPGLRVGLAWAGGVRLDQPELAAVDARRSIGLARLAPLAAIEGVSFVSLQKGDAAAQAAEPPPGLVLHDFTAGLRDFADTAALIANLDLVISVDTSVVHLAGALGKPVWLLNRFDTCWRWLLGRDDSPWYPTLRQFRQPRPGDWDGVIAAIGTALANPDLGPK